MTDIIEDYLREVESRLQGTEEQKRQITRELRSHLWEKVDAQQAEAPDRPRDEVARQVIDDFGSPHDLALAYGFSGPVLKKADTGETVLRIGRAVGRGTRKVLKGVAITLAVLLVLGIAGGVWAYYEFRPIIEKNAPYTVYDYSESCERAPCTGDAVTSRFFVHANAREVRFDLGVHHDDPSNGSVAVRVVNPNGTEMFNHTFAASTNHDASLNLAWPGQSGNWTVTYQYQRFEGHMDLQVFAIGLPRDALW